MSNQAESQAHITSAAGTPRETLKKPLVKTPRPYGYRHGKTHQIPGLSKIPTHPFVGRSSTGSGELPLISLDWNSFLEKHPQLISESSGKSPFVIKSFMARMGSKHIIFPINEDPEVEIGQSWVPSAASQRPAAADDPSPMGGTDDLEFERFLAQRQSQSQLTSGTTSNLKLDELLAKNQDLSLKVERLVRELHRNVPYLQLYRFGAGTFTLSLISLLTWSLSGTSIPFHPIFAAAALPVGIVFMLMAWITRKKQHEPPV